MSDSVRPHRQQPTRLPHPWDSPGKNTGVGCHFLLQCMKVRSESEVAQSCPTLCDPMDCSLPGSSVHGIFQARVLEWGAIAFSILYPSANYASRTHHSSPLHSDHLQPTIASHPGYHNSPYGFVCFIPLLPSIYSQQSSQGKLVKRVSVRSFSCF